MRKAFFPTMVILTIIMLSPYLSNANKSKTIPVSHLSTHPILGSLGQPLGKVIIIEGVTIDGDSLRMKEFSGILLLKVLRVNGSKLKKPVILSYRSFPWAPVNLAAGKSFKYAGYESGEMSGIPDEAFKYLPRVASRSYGFSVYFQICKDVQ